MTKSTARVREDATRAMYSAIGKARTASVAVTAAAIQIVCHAMRR